MQEIIEGVGGFPEVKLQNLPSYRTSLQAILKKIPRKNDLQMVPKMPEWQMNENEGE